jgi:MarR family 2-MHQ and catechol resistance regulon transcriptional repressor
MGTRHQGTAEEVRALDAFIKLIRCGDSVSARLAGSLTDAGLTDSQFGVLEALYHVGPLHQCDLGQKLLKSGGNITTVVDNLEKDGLVRRERGVADRRFVTVHLTAEGRRLVKRVFPEHLRRIVKEMGILTAGEQETLGRLCKILGRQQRE